MRLKLSALLLSTALVTGFGAAAIIALPAVAPVAIAQTAGEVDVDALLKLLPENMTGSYESKSYDAISGITSVRNLKLADKAAPDQNFVAVQELGLRGLDLEAIAYVTDFSKYGAAPDLCLVNTATFAEEEKSVGPVKVQRTRTVLPHHFWVGLSTG